MQADDAAGNQTFEDKMNRWEITGADENTGADISQVLDAPDEQSAEAIARAKGVLVAAVKRVEAPIVSYSDPQTPRGKRAIAPVAKPPNLLPPRSLIVDFAAVILLIVGCAMTFNGCQNVQNPYHMDRFHDDNAYGATANTLEQLKTIIGGAAFFIAGLIICTIAAIFWCSYAVIRSQALTAAVVRQSSSQPDETTPPQ